MKIVLTICSREKNKASQLMPAHERYLAPHITFAKSIADRAGTLLYFLSGKYGLISKDTEIPEYDYYLDNANVDELAQVVVKQMRSEGITNIEFYVENKESWAPYIKVIEIAAQKAGVEVCKRNLESGNEIF